MLLILCHGQVSSDRGFDLSCDDFNQNIRSMKLFSQESGSMDLLKRITLTFCDGSEKTVATQVTPRTGPVTVSSLIQ